MDDKIYRPIYMTCSAFLKQHIKITVNISLLTIIICITSTLYIGVGVLSSQLLRPYRSGSYDKSCALSIYVGVVVMSVNSSLHIGVLVCQIRSYLHIGEW